MKEDFSELVEYLDKRFEGLETEIKEVKSTLNTLLNSVDKLVGLIETYHQEQLALTSKVDRLERWIQEVAGKVGVELKS